MRYETIIKFHDSHLSTREQKFYSSAKPTITTFGPENYQCFMTIQVGSTTLNVPTSSVQSIITNDRKSQDMFDDGEIF